MLVLLIRTNEIIMFAECEVTVNMEKNNIYVNGGWAYTSIVIKLIKKR